MYPHENDSVCLSHYHVLACLTCVVDVDLDVDVLQVRASQPEWAELVAYCAIMDEAMDAACNIRLSQSNTAGASFTRLSDALNVRLCLHFTSLHSLRFITCWFCLCAVTYV